MPSAAAHTFANLPLASRKMTSTALSARIRVMMEQDEILDSRLLGDFHAFEPRGVSPTLARSGQLLGRKLRVVDKNVRPGRELQQALIELWIARLVIGGVDDRSGGGLKSESEASLRMVQPACSHARARHTETGLRR